MIDLKIDLKHFHEPKSRAKQTLENLLQKNNNSQVAIDDSYCYLVQNFQEQVFFLIKKGLKFQKFNSLDRAQTASHRVLEEDTFER